MTSDTALSRRALLAAVPVAAITVAPVASTPLSEPVTKPAAVSNTDPIFAAIEAQRKATADFGATITRKGEGLATEQEEDAANDLEIKTFDALLSTMPTTLAGFIALFQRFGEDRHWNYGEATSRSGPDSCGTVIEELIHQRWGDDTDEALAWIQMMELALRRIAGPDRRAT
jgi:hypothetical protein